MHRLDGWRMQIHGQQPVDTRRCEQVGHELGRDGLMAPLLLFLLGVR